MAIPASKRVRVENFMDAIEAFTDEKMRCVCAYQDNPEYANDESLTRAREVLERVVNEMLP